MNIRFGPVLGMLTLLGAGAIAGGDCEFDLNGDSELEIEVDDDGEIEIDLDDKGIIINSVSAFPAPNVFSTAC